MKVLLSLSLTPVDFKVSITLLINFEFAISAPFAVLFVVSIPNENVTLSGFTFTDAIPEVDTIVALLLVVLVMLLRIKEEEGEGEGLVLEHIITH